MILDSISLENFGAYIGKQQALLTPEDGKPIILFGGMNGGGKTTLLDAIQLAFYGPKARISNRGRLNYKDYLRESIHRGTDPHEGAGITISFRRNIEGTTRHFELSRSWKEGIKGIEETVRVLCDGIPDDIFTDHWDEVVESYLPGRIAHLFFFDGEQIKELAEGDHAAEILGTAIHTLLGLDLVERLETNLKIFERRKRAEGVDPETAQKLKQLQGELDLVDREQEKAAMEEGTLVNECGRLAKELKAKEDLFRTEGGELYLQRTELEARLASYKSEKARIENNLRSLVAGPLPLLMVDDLLAEVEKQSRHESEMRRSRVLRHVLESRDNDVMTVLRASNIPTKSIQTILKLLETDRLDRSALADEQLVLDADDGLASQVAHLRTTLLPAASQQSDEYLAQLTELDEQLVHLEGELARVPAAESIARLQAELDAIRTSHSKKIQELEAIRARRQTLQRQREAAESRMDKMGMNDIDTRYAEDDRLRMLKHSQRIRETLGRFRPIIVRLHTSNMETLMLESFRKLLRKKDLITGLTIDPETFEAILTDRNGKPLPFDRLSAGERQLLATSLLWGLARASGRPVPTIIDTPLGRLDSSHRTHLIERYFPNASHQVLLLSTDEEIVGPYYTALKPSVTRTYLLNHDEGPGHTNIENGYFTV